MGGDGESCCLFLFPLQRRAHRRARCRDLSPEHYQYPRCFWRE